MCVSNYSFKSKHYLYHGALRGLLAPSEGRVVGREEGDNRAFKGLGQGWGGRGAQGTSPLPFWRDPSLGSSLETQKHP